MMLNINYGKWVGYNVRPHIIETSVSKKLGIRSASHQPLYDALCKLQQTQI